ncbi:MAG TPA: hypothetical protein VIF62_37425, partial [Labilithrix sp.]
MADSKNPLSDLEDLDWDAALDEWEKNTFVPQVARDAETNRVAAPVGTEEEPKKPAPPRPAAGDAAPVSSPALKGSGEGTVIAPVPSELRNEPLRPSQRPPSPSMPPGSLQRPATSGGLSQLFSKGASPAPRPSRMPPADARAPEPSTKVAPPGEVLAAEAEQLAKTTRDADEPTAFGRTLADTAERAPLEPLSSIADDSATVVGDRERVGSISDAETATRHPADDEAPTAARPSMVTSAAALDDDDDAKTRARQSSEVMNALSGAAGVSVVPSTERERPPAPEGPTTFEGERPVSRWLDEKTTTAFRTRAA